MSSSPLNTWSSLHLISLEHHPLLILSSLFLYGIIPLDSFDSVDGLSESLLFAVCYFDWVAVIISIGVVRSVVYAQLLRSFTCRRFLCWTLSSWEVVGFVSFAFTSLPLCRCDSL